MSDIDPVYRQLAARIQGADGDLVPRILAKLANLEQAAILEALPDRDRDSSYGRSLKISGEFARKLNQSPEIVEKHLQELFEKGVIFPTRIGPQMARGWMQLHDAALSNPKYDAVLGEEYFNLWAMSAAKARPPLQAHLHPEAATLRVIPKWKSIEGISGVLPCEDMREILKAQELMALIPCPCKRSYRERKCGVPEHSCINVGRTAQYNLERGVGRIITYEEALHVLEEFERYPTVNHVINQKNVNQLICNCHSCCCIGFKEEAMLSSRFASSVNPEECQGCGVCVTRCQFGAVQLQDDSEFGAKKACVDPALCRGCGDCVITCPNEALQMRLVRPPEHIPDSLTIY